VILLSPHRSVNSEIIVSSVRLEVNGLRVMWFYIKIYSKNVVSNEAEAEVVLEQAAAIAYIIEDNMQEEDEVETVKDADLLPPYNVQQKESVEDIDINPELSEAQLVQLKQLLNEYKEIFSDVPIVTDLEDHKVELTQAESVTCKPYPTPYKCKQ